MRCSDYEELLSNYANDEISRTQREFIEEHLSDCAGCRKTLAGYASVRQHLSALKDIQHKPDLKEAVMLKIKGTNARSTTQTWVRPALVSLPVIAIMTALLVIQPWSAPYGSQTVLANVITATENIQSYRVINYSSHTSSNQPDTEPAILERIWEFVLPDRVHVIYNNFYNSTNNGVVSRIEETSEYYIIGENLYYLTDNVMDAFLDKINPFLFTGGIPSKESALGIMQFMGELQQLPDENIDGVDCLHYGGTPRWGDIPFEIWIGKDDYLIRQTTQRTEHENAISTITTRYYDFNTNITIEPPLTTSGELLPGWEVENIQSTLSLVPIDEAIEAISGNEDWSNPTVLEKVFEMMGKVRDPWAYFYALPSEAQDALIDSIVNYSQTTDVRTTTKTVSSGYNDGVFRYSNSGTGLDVVIDIGEVNNEDSGVMFGTTALIDLWISTILAPDPQAYFDALSVETQQAMAVALSDNSIFATIMHELD